MSYARSGHPTWKLRDRPALREDLFFSSIPELQEQTGLSSLALRVCLQRGLGTASDIEAFLSPRFENLTHPFLLKDMELSVERISQARKLGQKVRIFGDYDVDGTTGTALLSWIFREFEIHFDATQPDRFKDGYGLNVRAVETAQVDGIALLITVDCGTTNFDAIARAKELGLDVIVIDHHQLDVKLGLPEAYAVVNPQREDCESDLKQLCGCGLAFYLAMGLRIKGRQEGWFSGRAEPNLKQHLDLVVMATSADMVPLTGDNHILIRYGLEVLKFTQKPGIQALLKAAGIQPETVSASHLGFVLGPRINASGRMVSASLALRLLTTTDPEEARLLAEELEQLNRDRAAIQNEIWDQVKVNVEEGLAQGKYLHGIVVGNEGWHEGVVGIVASRVTETFKKPCAVVALREDFGKGSVRSYAGKDVLSALRACSDFLMGFGGHKHAAGLTVSLDQFEGFSQAFDLACENLSEDHQGGSLMIEGNCLLEELTLKSLQELERLGPFGPGNPEPVFTLRACVKDHRVLKGRHLKLTLQARNPHPGLKFASPGIEAIWFYGAERNDFSLENARDQEHEWAGIPEINRFGGQLKPVLRLRDFREIT